MTTIARPIPVPDPSSEPFWAATRRHELALARCSRCGVVSHPPDLVCPHCGSSDPRFTFEPVTPSGTIRSWTVIHQSFLPGFDDEPPFVLVDVQLDGIPDVRFIGRLLDGPNVDLRLGLPVRLAFEDLSPEISVPAFALGDDR